MYTHIYIHTYIHNYNNFNLSLLEVVEVILVHMLANDLSTIYKEENKS